MHLLSYLLSCLFWLFDPNIFTKWLSVLHHMLSLGCFWWVWFDIFSLDFRDFTSTLLLITMISNHKWLGPVVFVVSGIIFNDGDDFNQLIRELLPIFGNSVLRLLHYPQHFLYTCRLLLLVNPDWWLIAVPWVFMVGEYYDSGLCIIEHCVSWLSVS